MECLSCWRWKPATVAITLDNCLLQISCELLQSLIGTDSWTTTCAFLLFYTSSTSLLLRGGDADKWFWRVYIKLWLRLPPPPPFSVQYFVLVLLFCCFVSLCVVPSYKVDFSAPPRLPIICYSNDIWSSSSSSLFGIVEPNFSWSTTWSFFPSNFPCLRCIRCFFIFFFHRENGKLWLPFECVM